MFDLRKKGKFACYNIKKVKWAFYFMYKKVTLHVLKFMKKPSLPYACCHYKIIKLISILKRSI